MAARLVIPIQRPPSSPSVPRGPCHGVVVPGLELLGALFPLLLDVAEAVPSLVLGEAFATSRRPLGEVRLVRHHIHGWLISR